MSQIVNATFDGGFLKPDEALDLPQQARVRLIIEPMEEQCQPHQEAWAELERLWEEASIDSGGKHLPRDQLHERH